MTPARQTGPETATIECESCLGNGWVLAEKWPKGNGWVKVVDIFCDGTGREPATVQPREEQKP